VRRAAVQLAGRRLFHGPPGVHDQNPVGGLGDYAEVVGYQHQRQAHFPLHRAEQLQDLGLDGYVQRAGRLVGDDHLGPAAAAWLSLEPLRIWLEHAPAPALVGAAGQAAIAVVQRGDYAAGYRAVRRILGAGQARVYEPGTSQARYMLAALACWFEPIENAVQAGQQAREGLIAAGDLANTGDAYHLTSSFLLDCAPTLDGFAAEVEEGLAFARRTGNEPIGQWLGNCRWLLGVLSGEDSAAASAADPAGRAAGNPMALALTAAIAAAIFGDQAALARHVAAAMMLLLLPDVEGSYTGAVVRLLRGLVLAGQARRVEGEERAALLAELEELAVWLAARAADAPDNFGHLLRLAEAERAWAVGDFRAAAQAFDAARREAAGRCRPWHGALITERPDELRIGSLIRLPSAGRPCIMLILSSA
jgi:hypothetical protein